MSKRAADRGNLPADVHTGPSMFALARVELGTRPCYETVDRYFLLPLIGSSTAVAQGIRRWAAEAKGAR